METSPKKSPWTAKRVVHEVMAIWFGSVHALSTVSNSSMSLISGIRTTWLSLLLWLQTITFAIHDLCTHSEYVVHLRQELLQQYDTFKQTGNGLPLLDSFIKESARLTPVESSMRPTPSLF